MGIPKWRVCIRGISLDYSHSCYYQSAGSIIRRSMCVMSVAFGFNLSYSYQFHARAFTWSNTLERYGKITLFCYGLKIAHNAQNVSIIPIFFLDAITNYMSFLTNKVHIKAHLHDTICRTRFGPCRMWSNKHTRTNVTFQISLSTNEQKMWHQYSLAYNRMIILYDKSYPVDRP